MALRPSNPESRAEQLAKRDAAQKDVFLREVDEALRQDQMLGAMKRYGLLVGALVTLLLLGLGGYLWWGNHRDAQSAERSEKFTIALDQIEAGNLAGGATALVPLTEGSGGSAAAAKLMQASIALEQGRQAEAIKGFAAIAADSSAPQPFRDLAAIREVATQFDTMPPQQVVDRLKPLAVPGNPWFGSAGELVGMAYLKLGKNQLAGPLFAAISRDKTAPDSLRSRARQMAGLLGVDAIDDVAKAAGIVAEGSAAPTQP
ncbi:MAG TPA: tetratricopeptide repeat protein [Novosphingobium sp.]|nr:tetratricopeptide repeat protein [Novosphingobium sp.]